ncbi:hypothetical protein BH23BAC1_BH23BAC1_48290 [soil metagenome]
MIFFGQQKNSFSSLKILDYFITIFCLFKKQIQFFLYFFLLSNNIHAQQYFFRTWGLEEGLPQSQVYDIIQDTRGFLWVCTNGGGVARFNGRNFKVFNTQNGLVHNQVRNSMEDSKGNIWLVTYNGLSKYDGYRFHNFTEKNGYPNCMYANIFEDSEGIIWIYTLISPGQAKLFYIENNRLIDFTTIDEFFEKNKLLGRTFFRDILLSKEGYFFLTTNVGLMELKEGKIVPSPLQELPEFQNKRVWPLLEEKGGELWLYTEEGTRKGNLYRLEEGILQLIKLPAKIQANQVHVLIEDKNGQIWMTGENTGLLQFRNGSFEVFNRSNGLLVDLDYIFTIQEDIEGNIWLGTNNGLVRYNENQFLTFGIRNIWQSSNITGLFQDSQERYWIGTGAGEIILYDGYTQKTILSSEKSPLIRMNDMHELEDGSFLIASHQGLWLYNSQNLTPANSKYGLSKDMKISSITAIEDTLWFSTLNDGAFCYTNGKSYMYTNKGHGLSSDYVRTIDQDKKGNLWFCTFSGVSSFNGKKFKNYGAAQGLGTDLIFQMAEDKTGALWFATYGKGLARFDGKKFDYVTTFDGLNSDNLYSVLIDNEGNIWAGTQNGVDKITLDGEGKVSSIRNFGLADGFLGGETNGNVNMVAQDGSLWFGTRNGAIKVNPDIISAFSVPPKVYITHLKIFFKTIEWNSKSYVKQHTGISPWFNLPLNLTLPYHQNHFSFVFESPTFSAPEKIKYQWLLEGLDREWSPLSDQTEVIYPELSPGTYTFLVKALTSDQVWSEQPASYSFTIITPVWRRWWFISIILGIILIGLITTVRSLTGRKLKKQLQELEVKQQLQEERERIARELHDNVGASLAYILNHLNRTAAEISDQAKQKKILQISSITKNTIDQLRQTIWAINKEELTLQELKRKILNYFDDQNYSESALVLDITANCDNQNTISSFQALNLFRIAQETITNAYKHSNASRISVFMENIQENKLKVKFEDDGQGFNPQESISEDHYGLKNIKFRAKAIGADICIHSAPGKGTRIEIILPI